MVELRETSYGQTGSASPVDRLGVWLNTRAVLGRTDFAGRRIADIGCGFEATLTRHVLTEVAEATVIDVALSAQIASHPKVVAREGSIDDVLPTLREASLDVVMCINVLEHLIAPQTALDEFRRVLAPGGTLLLNVPSWRGKTFLELSSFRLGLSPKQEMDDHKRYYDPRDLWPMLVAAGFLPSEIRCRRHKLTLNTFARCGVPL